MRLRKSLLGDWTWAVVSQRHSNRPAHTHFAIAGYRGMTYPATWLNCGAIYLVTVVILTVVGCTISYSPRLS